MRNGQRKVQYSLLAEEKKKKRRKNWSEASKIKHVFIQYILWNSMPQDF